MICENHSHPIHFVRVELWGTRLPTFLAVLKIDLTQIMKLILIDVVIDEDCAPRCRPLVLALLARTKILDFHPALEGRIILEVLPEVEILYIWVEP